MKRWLLATMVVILVLCILVIVFSPYVDLPLTTLRGCLAVVLFAQALLLGRLAKEPTFSLRTTRIGTPGVWRTKSRSCAPLLPLHCAYLC